MDQIANILVVPPLLVGPGVVVTVDDGPPVVLPWLGGVVALFGISVN